MDGPYARFAEKQLILRDYLAIDRTILANERTWLAYVRTALTQFIAGVTFVKFFDSRIMAIIGWIFIPLGLATLAFGFARYKKTKRYILLAGAAQASEESSERDAI